MDDVVAVAIELPDGSERYVMTWGRVQQTVDPAPLEALVLRHATKFGLTDAVQARVCLTLREAVDGPYFYEALISFGQRPIPFGPDYEAWRAERADEMEQGRDLYYLGAP